MRVISGIASSFVLGARVAAMTTTTTTTTTATAAAAAALVAVAVTTRSAMVVGLVEVSAGAAALVGVENKGSFQRWGWRFVSFRVVPE